MALNINRFVKQTIAFNAGQITTAENPSMAPVISNGPSSFTYASSVDTLAVIAAPNYFSSVVYDLSVNDRLDITGSDGSGFYIVSAVNRPLRTITISIRPSSGMVNTANIQNGAVTSPKLAANLLHHAVVNIPDQDFAFMYVAPVLLIPAAGPNTLITIDRIELLMTFGSAPWANGGIVRAQYDSVPMGGGGIASTGLNASVFYQTSSSAYGFIGAGQLNTFIASVNKGIYLANITSAFTGGDSNFVAHVWYKTIPTV